MRFRKCLLAFMLLGPVLHDCFAATVLKGQIVDAGGEGGAGIPGVTVRAYSANSTKMLGETITDTAGRYELSVTAPGSAPLRLWISRIGYFARPTIQEVAPSAEQKMTRLVRESAADGYYMQVSDNVLKSPGSSLEAYLPAILSLPAKQKGLILEALKGANQSVFAEFSKADKAVLAVQELNTTPHILAFPNFGKSGTVLLTGKVASPGEKADLESQIAKKPGVFNVRSEVEIVPSMEKETGRSLKPVGSGG
jgi:hypothetical protein